MEVLVKGIVIGAAVIAAVAAIAAEWWQYRNVPQPYTTHGQRRGRND